MNSQRILEKFWTDFKNKCKIPLISLFQSFFICKLGKSNLFADLKQNHKVNREKDICPQFCNGADLRFHAQYQAEYDLSLPLSNGHHKTGNNKKFVKIFDLMNSFGLC